MVTYVIKAAISVFGNILSRVLAPVFCLRYFVFHEDSGYLPDYKAGSAPKESREYLYPSLSWISTHDAPLDEYWWVYRHHSKYLSSKTQEEYDNSEWLKYVSRIYWVWRNPAYKLRQMLGWNSYNSKIETIKDDNETWDSGQESTGYIKATSNHGNAFLWEKQKYFYKQWCVELQFGYKLYRTDSDGKRMVAFRVALKNYPKE